MMEKGDEIDQTKVDELPAWIRRKTDSFLLFHYLIATRGVFFTRG